MNEYEDSRENFRNYMEDTDKVEAQCVVCPDGTLRWVEVKPGRGQKDIKRVVEDFKKFHPQYDMNGNTMNISTIIMSREDFERIPRDGTHIYVYEAEEE